MGLRYGTEQGNKIIAEALNKYGHLFTDREQRVIRYWGKYWDLVEGIGKEVYYSAAKTAEILGKSPQTIIRWLRKGYWDPDAIVRSVHGRGGTSASDGYLIPLSIIIDERLNEVKFGKHPRLSEYEHVTLEMLVEALKS